MKKNIFMISVAMLALVSCTNDEVIQLNKGQKIGFHSAMETRATVLEQENLESFYVTALNDKDEVYFSDIEFKKGTDIYFNSDQAYYWPDGVLDFYAYYPSASELDATISITGEGQTLTDYTPSTDIEQQLDFITARNSGSKNNESVELNFNHQLSQIEINGSNNNKGYNIYVKAISIRNAVKKGDFNFYDYTWSLGEELTDYEIEFDEAITLSDEIQSFMDNKGSAMLIPQKRLAWGVEAGSNDNTDPDSPAQTADDDENGGTENGTTGGGDETPATPETDPNGTYIAFLVKAYAKQVTEDGTTTDGIRIFPLEGDENEYAWVAKPLAFDWTAGYKYTYNFDFSNGLGVIAPGQGDPDDPDNPYNPGEDVYGGKIEVDVSFYSWKTTTNQTIKPQEPETPTGGGTGE